MTEQVKKMTEKVGMVFAATEESLTHDWDRKANLQFPNLLTFVVNRLKLDAETAAEIEPYVRNYVRKHPAYYVSRGAKGGIMLRSVYETRLAKKSDAEATKKAAKDQIDAKIAATKVVDSK